MSAGTMASAKAFSERTAQWAAIALGVSIPISVAFDNVLLVVVLAGWLLSGDYREALRAVGRSRMMLAALVLYGLLLAGMLRGDGDTGEAARVLGKYLNLLFIPVFAVLLREAPRRRCALLGFAVSLGLTLVLSYLLAAGVPFPRWMVLGDTSNPAVFKQYLTHGILLAFGAFLFAQLAFAASTPKQRAFWAVAALLAAANVLIMMQGRTGHLVLILLALYLGFAWRGWRGLAISGAAVTVMVTALIYVPGTFQERYGLTAGDHASSKASKGAQVSNKQRLDFYRTSLAIIREHPLLGIGTGGFPRAYADKTRGTDVVQTRNPHNEYLYIAAQLGIVGLAALLWLFAQHWRESARLASPLECRLSRGLLLAIAFACLFNSLLLDHTEGLLYAWLTGMLFGGLKSSE